MKKYWISICFCAALLTGCATTYLQQSTNVSNIKKNYDKLLIVSKSRDMTARIKTEQEMVKDLAAMGVKAESSIEVIKTESFNKELTEKELDALRESLVAKGYDGIVITNLVNAQEYTDVVPGSPTTAYMPMRYGRFGRYYSAYPATYWEPDRVETGIEYTLESCLYDLTIDQGDNLQWVGRFKVKNPTDLMKVIEKYSSELATELNAQSISN
jgi:Fe2+ transport system protein FeoA